MMRGEIYWAVLKPRSGSEQAGKRPVIILSHDGFNLTPSWKSIIVIPLSTSSSQSKRGPTAVFLPEGAAGLKKDSSALCHQITTLDRSKLTERVGRLSAEDLKRIEEGLKAAVGL